MKINLTRFGWLLAAMMLVSALAACQPAAPAYEGETVTTVEAQVPPEEQVAVDVNDLVAPPLETVTWEDAETTESGLQYIVITPGEGQPPQDGDMITMNYVAKLTDDTVLADTSTNGGPAIAILGRDQLLPGWEEGLKLMKPGEKANFLLPPELAFGAEGYGSIPPNAQIILEVELISVEAPPVPPEVDAADLTATDSGLQYYDLQVGDGTEATDGSTVSTEYTIWVQGGAEDGSDLFVSASQGRGPATFVLGQITHIFPGWDEGTHGMKVGGKRYLVIPPELGLGEQGAGEIPPNATLLMVIELTNVVEPVTMTEVPEEDYTVTDSGLKYYDIEVGDGPTPQEGQTVVVEYTGWLAEDGTKFDSSLDHGQPFKFVLGSGMVIPGWDEGVSTMQVGGYRQLVVPPDLAYGEQGAGGVIPPNATLIFEIRLLSIEDTSP